MHAPHPNRPMGRCQRQRTDAETACSRSRPVRRSTARRWRTQSWFRRNRGGIGLAAVVFVIHSFSPSVQIGDSRLSALTAWQFLTHFDLHLQDYPMVAQLGNSYDLVFAGGNTLPYFPWPTMLLAIPADILLLLTGRSAADLTLADPESDVPGRNPHRQPDCRDHRVGAAQRAAVPAATSPSRRGWQRSAVRSSRSARARGRSARGHCGSRRRRCCSCRWPCCARSGWADQGGPGSGGLVRAWRWRRWPGRPTR